MRVLINIKSSPAQKYIVHLPTKTLIDEVRGLVERKKHSEAMFAVMSKGNVLKEIIDSELHTVKVDLILSENSAGWDLTK